MRKVLSSIALSLCTVAALAQPKYEVRAVWLTTNGGLDWPKGETSVSQQKADLCEILDKLEDANFNTIIFQAQVKGDVAWMSNKQPAMNAFTGNGSLGLSYDVSQFVIDECHKRNMECHAWIVPYRIGTQKEANKYKDNTVKHVTVTHPELCVLYNGAYYLDPGLPATREYLLDVYKELLSNYNFDGVNFDYTRYPGSEFDDAASYAAYNPEYLPKDDWRRNNINTFIAEFYEMAKSINPDIKVGAAPIGTYKNVQGYGNMTAYGSVYQDACQWMQSGNHDLLIPQMYWNEKNGFSPNMVTWVNNSAGRQLVVGLAPYKMVDGSNNWETSVITDQIEKVRAQEGMSGVCFFRTDHVIDVTQSKIATLYNQLCDDYFKYPSHIVPMDYNGITTPNAPRNVKQERNGWDYTITWDEPNPDTENTPIKYYSVYLTNGTTVDTSDLQKVVAFKVKGNKFVYSSLDSSLTFAVTAFDKNYYESQPALSDAASLDGIDAYSKIIVNNDVINVSGAKTIAAIEVYSMMGDCVVFENVSGVEASVDCSHVSNGVYIFCVKYEDGSSVVDKFIK